MNTNIKRGLMFLTLTFIVISTMCIVSASDNATDEITLNDEQNQNVELDISNKDSYEQNDESDQKLEISDEDLLTDGHVTDYDFRIDPTKTKNYGTIQINEYNIRKVYVSKNYDDWVTYTPKFHSIHKNGQTKTYYTIDMELPTSPGTYNYRLYSDYFTMPKVNYFKVTIAYGSLITVSEKTVKVGETANIDFNVALTQTSLIKDIEITVNGQTSILKSGTRSFKTIFDKPGQYTGYIKLNLDNYETSWEKFYVKVYEEPLIITQDYYRLYLGKTNNLHVYVVDSNGNPINSGKIYLNSYDYSGSMSSPVKNGYATFSITPKCVGVEYYKLEYSPLNTYYKSVSINEAIPILTVSTATLTINTHDAILSNSLKIDYSLKDALGNPISNAGKFIVNGKTYSSLSDIPLPKSPGTYTYNIKFEPNSVYYDSISKAVTISFKQKTKITVKTVKGYEGKKIKLTAIVKDGFGKKIKNGKVIFKFRGKKYNVNVKNGKAIKYIKVPKTSRSIFYKYKTKNGKEIVTEVYQNKVLKGKVYFIGNSKFIKSSSKFKIISKKKSKSYRFKPLHMYEGPGEKSVTKHKSVKKTKAKKKTKTKKKKKKTKSYGYYPKYHKKIPDLDVNLFKQKPAFDTNTKLSDIKIIV